MKSHNSTEKRLTCDSVKDSRLNKSGRRYSRSHGSIHKTYPTQTRHFGWIGWRRLPISLAGASSVGGDRDQQPQGRSNV